MVAKTQRHSFGLPCVISQPTTNHPLAYHDSSLSLPRVISQPTTNHPMAYHDSISQPTTNHPTAYPDTSLRLPRVTSAHHDSSLSPPSLVSQPTTSHLWKCASSQGSNGTRISGGDRGLPLTAAVMCACVQQTVGVPLQAARQRKDLSSRQHNPV